GVVLRPAAPHVDGHLVVVPRDDPRYGGVQGVQVGVVLVERVPGPVLGPRDGLVRGLGLADHGAAGVELAGAVLVDVVAQVHDHVEVPALGQVPVGGEVAGLPVRAAHHAHSQPGDGGVVGGCGHRAADRRPLP